MTLHKYANQTQGFSGACSEEDGWAVEFENKTQVLRPSRILT